MKLCAKHGGNVSEVEAFWLCEICSSEGINKCKCGGTARYFGEALMSAITCQDCGVFLMDVGWDLKIRERWNKGERGYVE